MKDSTKVMLALIPSILVIVLASVLITGHKQQNTTGNQKILSIGALENVHCIARGKQRQRCQLLQRLQTPQPSNTAETYPVKLGSFNGSRTSYDVIGTPTASSSLTAFYTGNQKILSIGALENVHLDIRYSPLTGQTNRFAEVLLEGSNDNGVNYFPISSKVVGTDEIDLYVTSTADGFPLGIVIPGNKISVGSTTYHGQYDQDMIADHIRISVRESGTTNFGFIYVRGTFSSKM